MPYLRIDRGKFWGWVVVSLLVGLGIGLVIMMVRTGSLSSQITVLQHQLASATTGTGTADAAALQDQLASAEASITALTQQNAQLTSDLSAAQNSSSQGSGTATNTAPTIAVVSRNVSPSTVATSGSITLTVKVTGGPSKVTMRIYTSSKSFDKTYTLKKKSTSGDTETWTLKIAAPVKAGTYHYYATAILGSTRVTLPGATPKTFTVH
jgi:hypothetical protein